MQENGRVTGISGNMAEVEVAHKEACHSCPSESFCSLATGGSRKIDAVNEAGAKPGDEVRIEISSKNILTGAFFVYMFPVLALLAAAGLTQLAGGSQNKAIIAGLAALAASVLVIRSADRKMGRSRKLVPVIKEVL